jgi:cellulose synthase operon protein C
MPRILKLALLLVSAMAVAAEDKSPEKKTAKDAELGKKETNAGPSKDLAGDTTRKVEKKGELAPALQYDQFRLGVETQVQGKRKSQIDDLEKIIKFDSSSKEMPKLLFRLGELYWEESKYQFFEANRQDDALINAMNRNDKAGQEKAKAEKERILAISKDYAKKATERYAEIVQKYKDFERTDEVLYFLGQNLMEMGEERKALAAYKRLIEKYPKSKFVADAHLAFGEYYFNGSKGKREMLERALASYIEVEKFPENKAYPFAIYKEGWCYFNLSDYQKAMDKFRTVVLYAKLQGTAEVEGGEGKSKGYKGLVKEARNDFVRAYSRAGGSPTEAKVEFAKLTDTGDERFGMMKGLAGLYYEEGKDKEAALTYDMLIKEKPLSCEVPGFQSRIIDCVMRAGNKRMTVQQVRRLVKLTEDVKKNGADKIKDEKEKEKCEKSLTEAGDLSERTVSNLAVNWHNEARKTRDDETYGFANEVYGDYLTLYPDNKKAYDLRFFWAELLNDNLAKYDRAAEEYTKVLMMDVAALEKGGEVGPDGKKKPVKPGKYFVNSAYNAILAYDQVLKSGLTSGKVKAPMIQDIHKVVDMSPEVKQLLEACERYIKYIPNPEKLIEIQYKIAKIYYDHNNLDEAVKRFASIALEHPEFKFENGDKAGEIAANLVLDSYNLLQDWEKVNEWARKFYANEKLAQGKFREDLAKLIEQSSFKLVNQYEAKKEYGKAADMYVKFVTEFPQSELSDKALYNASIDYFNARMLDKAIETRKRIITQYPKSTYVPATLYALAEGYEAIADFSNAADYYEQYASAYGKAYGKKISGKGAKAAKAAPAKAAKKGKGKDKGKDDDKKEEAAAPTEKKGEQVWEESKAQIALFNAGVFREGLGQYKQALTNREEYLAIWPDSKDAEAVFLSIVDLHEKTEHWAAAVKQLEEYEKKYGKDVNKFLTAEGRISGIWETKKKDAKSARKVHERVLGYYEQKVPKKQKDTLEITALDAVARAHFVTNEDQYKKYSAIKLKWTKLTNIAEFKNSVKDKAKALEEIQKLYTKTVTFKSADPAICALLKIGLAYDNFAQTLSNAPTPKGMPEDLKQEFITQLEQQAAPVREKAAEAFQSAVAKSSELDVFNKCTDTALELLRNKYKPEQFPKMREDVLEVKLPALANVAIGGDMIATIKAIPVPGERPAEGEASKIPDAPPEKKDEPVKGDNPPGKKVAKDGKKDPNAEPGGDEPL